MFFIYLFYFIVWVLLMLLVVRVTLRNVNKNDFFSDPKKYILELEGNPSFTLMFVGFSIFISILSIFTSFGN
jgi:hypothetical protein